MPKKILLLLFAALAMLGAACGGDDTTDMSARDDAGSADTTGGDGAGGDKQNVVVGSFNFSESAILAHIYGGALEVGGYDVEVRANLGSREVVEPALESGEINLVPEYASTLLEFVNNGAGEASGDVDAVATKLNEHLESRDLVALEPSPAADQNAFAVTRATAEKYNLQKMSDLAAVAGELTLGGPPECPQRPFCQPGLEQTYGARFQSFRPLDAGGPLTKAALENGDIDVGLVFSSDGGVEAKDLVVLEDDKMLQNADNVIPVVSAELAADEEAVEIIDKVSAALTTDDLIAMNKRADIDKEDPEALAEEWLRENGFAAGD